MNPEPCCEHMLSKALNEVFGFNVTLAAPPGNDTDSSEVEILLADSPVQAIDAYTLTMGSPTIPDSPQGGTPYNTPPELYGVIKWGQQAAGQSAEVDFGQAFPITTNFIRVKGVWGPWRGDPMIVGLNAGIGPATGGAQSLPTRTHLAPQIPSESPGIVRAIPPFASEFSLFADLGPDLEIRFFAEANSTAALFTLDDGSNVRRPIPRGFRFYQLANVNAGSAMPGSVVWHLAIG